MLSFVLNDEKPVKKKTPRKKKEEKKGSSLYVSNGIFDHQSLEAYSPLKNFVNHGYAQILKREKRDVKDAFIMNSESRTCHDVQTLIRGDLQQHVPELQQYTNERFF